MAGSNLFFGRATRFGGFFFREINRKDTILVGPQEIRRIVGPNPEKPRRCVAPLAPLAAG